MAGVDLPIRELGRDDTAIMDISAESEAGVSASAGESTPPAVFVEGLLRQWLASKTGPKIMSPVKIELPTDPKTLQVLCSLDEIAKHEAGSQKHYPVIVGAYEDVVAFLVGNDRDREAVVKWHAGEAEKAKQNAPNGYRLRDFVWRDRGGEHQPWTAVLEPLQNFRRTAARNLTDAVNRMWETNAVKPWEKK